MIHKLLEKLQKSTIEFTRTPHFDEATGILSCDCAGFLTLILKELNRFPKELNGLPRAFEYFDFVKRKGAKSNIDDLKRYDILLWRKSSIPSTGDSGHILLLLSKPKRVADYQYEARILEVTKSSRQLIPRTLLLMTKKDGTLNRIQWDPNSKKVKEVELLGFSFFDSQDCEGCGYPEERCLCQELPSPKWNAPEILILKHPSEDKHALSTVSLMEKVFTNLKVETGESFKERKGTLIYPLEENNGMRLDTETCLNEKFFEDYPTPWILVDGTWKKSKRIILSNPWLQKLPRIEIKQEVPSQYRLRKQKDKSSYSTLETYSFLWKKLESKTENQSEALLQIFSAFIDKQELFLR